MSSKPECAMEDAVPKPQGDADNIAGDEVAELRTNLASALAHIDAARARESALEAELLHRVRNTLAVVRSIFSRTVENAETLEHASDHFRGRLDTLAHYQLRTGPAGGFHLEDMVRDTLMVFAVTYDPRIEIEGPEVRLDGRIAESVGLALHELATNSIKFGMLAPASTSGRLSLRWTLVDDILSFEWLEDGIAILSSAPLRTGFGREYIEQALPYQISAETSFEFTAGRLRCALTIPLAN
jgi:two-component sensor histidine kinase